jgi:hypothetical protein
MRLRDGDSLRQDDVISTPKGNQKPVMARLRFKAERIFTGTAMADPGSVLVMDEDGTVEGIVPAEEAGEELRHLNSAISKAG